MIVFLNENKINELSLPRTENECEHCPQTLCFITSGLGIAMLKKLTGYFPPVQKIGRLQHGEKLSEQHKRNNVFKETAFLKTKIIKMKLQNTFFIKKERN